MQALPDYWTCSPGMQEETSRPDTQAGQDGTPHAPPQKRKEQRKGKPAKINEIQERSQTPIPLQRTKRVGAI
jgi:hypothetical protein